MGNIRPDFLWVNDPAHLLLLQLYPFFSRAPEALDASTIIHAFCYIPAQDPLNFGLLFRKIISNDSREETNILSLRKGRHTPPFRNTAFFSFSFSLVQNLRYMHQHTSFSSGRVWKDTVHQHVDVLSHQNRVDVFFWHPLCVSMEIISLVGVSLSCTLAIRGNA